MGATPALRLLSAQRAPERLVRGRGEAQRVVLKVDDALEPCQSGVALCGEVQAIANRIYSAVASDALMVAGHEAARLVKLAETYSAEFRRMAGEIEGYDGPRPVVPA